MEVTEVRVSLRTAMRSGERETHAGSAPAMVKGGPGQQRLKAYATITFDNCFVVRNIKIIEGRQGLFVAMPSHKAKTACLRCQFKNDVGGRFCIQCGSRFPLITERSGAIAAAGDASEASAHRDIAHPITADFRHYLQQRVLEVYETERGKARQYEDVAVLKAIIT